MADTITTNYGFIKPDIGGSTDTWGDKVNDNLDDIDSTIKSVADSVVTVSNSLSTLASTVSGISTSLSFKADASSVYTKGQIDGFRTTDQNAAKDAGNLTAGTVPDARLPARLQSYSKLISDWNGALANGWYMADPSISALNAPTSSAWCFGQVIVHNGDWLEQRVVAFTAEEFGARPTYKRWRFSGTWGGWQRVYETAAEIKSLFPSYISSPITITSAGTFTLTHSLGSKPTRVDMFVKCLTAEGGYSVGDEVEMKTTFGYTSVPLGCSLTVSNTQIVGKFSSYTAPIPLLRKDTGALMYCTNTGWELYVRAAL